MNQSLKQLLRRILILPSILLGLLSLVYLSGCNKNNNKTETPTQTLYDLIQSTPGLDSLYKYVSFYPDIVTTLKDAGSHTFFAPTNDAFASLMATPGFPSNIAEINPDLIKSVLLYHIADQVYSKNQLTPGTSVTTEEMEAITVNSDGTLKTGATNPNIEIDQADINATNGVMHTTKSVLIPPSVGATLTPLLGTVAGTLMLSADFSMLAKAIQKADSFVPTGSSPLISMFSSTTSQVTVFAPPNEVFSQGNIKVSDYSDTVWRYIILYHAISGAKKSTDLTQRSYPSLSYLGEDLYITNNSGAFYVNGYPIVVPNASPASDGIVHVLGGFLVPGSLLGGDLVGVLKQQGFDSLVVALNDAGMTATLESNNPYTVLAPPNAAFTALLTTLGVTAISQIPQDQLQALISYHILSGYYFTPDFTDGTSYHTLLSGVDIKANNSSSGVSFTDAKGVTVPVVSPDVKALNGVIQVIGGVLQPQ